MPEALDVLLGYAFEHLGAQRIFGECDAANKPSARVMEKVGLYLGARSWKRQGPTDELSETLHYVVNREEWQRNHLGANLFSDGQEAEG